LINSKKFEHPANEEYFNSNPNSNPRSSSNTHSIGKQSMNVVASVNLSSNIDNSIIKGFRNKSNEKKKSQNEDYDSSNGRPKS